MRCSCLSACKRNFIDMDLLDYNCMSGSDPMTIDFVLDKRLWISWYRRLRFCGRCRNLEFTFTIYDYHNIIINAPIPLKAIPWLHETTITCPGIFGPTSICKCERKYTMFSFVQIYIVICFLHSLGYYWFDSFIHSFILNIYIAPLQEKS